MAAQRSSSISAHALVWVAGSLVRGRRAAWAWWQVEGWGVPDGGVGAGEASAVSARAGCWAQGKCWTCPATGRHWCWWRESLARQNRAEETAVKPSGVGEIVTEIVTTAISVHFNIVEASARDQVSSAAAGRRAETLCTATPAFRWHWRFVALLTFSWVRPGRGVDGDGQAGDALEVAEAVPRARLVARVTGDVLRQVSKESSDDLVFAQVRLGAGAEVSVGVVSFSYLHVQVGDLRLGAAGDGGDSLVEVQMCVDMEGVDRAIESIKGELNSLQERL
ncbi:hypothetical protein ACSSS7_006110 [Eimeria intestinalis]